MPAVNSQTYRLIDDDLALQDAMKKLSARSFDYSPNTYSSNYMQRMKDGYDAIVSTYAGKGSGNALTIQEKNQVDLIISAMTGADIKQVSRNHNAYVRMITGSDMEDKGFIKAFSDGWKSQDYSMQIGKLMNRFDDSEDEEEKASIMEEIQSLQDEIVKTGDYTDDRGFIQSALVEFAPVGNQMLRTTAYSALGALVLSGAVAATIGTGGIAAPSLLGLAASVGSGAGAAIDAVTNVFAQERGNLSYDLYNMVDADGNHMDDEVRERAADIGGAIITIIEYAIPDPGFSKLFRGLDASKIIRNSVLEWVFDVGTGMVSESFEEGLQGAAGYITEALAEHYSDETGKTSFGKTPVKDIIAGAIEEGISNFTQAMTASGVASLVGNTISLPSTIAQNRTYRNLTKEYTVDNTKISRDAYAEVQNRQSVTRGNKILPSRLIEFEKGKPSQIIAPQESGRDVGQNQSGVQTQDAKYGIPSVVENDNGRYEGVTQYDKDLLKTLYNNKARHIAVNIIRESDTRFTSDQITNLVENGYRAVADIGVVDSETGISGNTIYFASQHEMNRFFNDNKADITQISDGFSYIDENGNRIEVNTVVDEDLVNDIAPVQEMKDLHITDRMQENNAQTSAQVQNASHEKAEKQIHTQENVSNSSESKQDNVITQEKIDSMTEEELAQNEENALWNLVNEKIGIGINNTSDNTSVIGKKKMNKITDATVQMLHAIERATGIDSLEMLDRIDFTVDTSDEAKSGYVHADTDGNGRTTFTIALNKKSTVKTVIHELAHVLRMSLSPEQLEEFNLAYMGRKNGIWPEEITERDGKFYLGNMEYSTFGEALSYAEKNEEKFVQDFIHYFSDNWAPNETVGDFFNKLKYLIQEVIGTFKNALSKNVVNAFNQLFSRDNAPRSTDTIGKRYGTLFETQSRAERLRNEYQERNSITNPTGAEFKSAHDSGYIIPDNIVLEKMATGTAEERSIAEKEIAMNEIINAIPDEHVRILSKEDNAETAINEVRNKVNPAQINESAYIKLHNWLHAPTLQKQTDAFIRKYRGFAGILRLKQELQSLQTYSTANSRYSVTRKTAPYRSALYNLIKDVDGDTSTITLRAIEKSFSTYSQEWLRLLYDAGKTLPGFENVSTDELRYYISIGEERKYTPMYIENNPLSIERNDMNIDEITDERLDAMIEEENRLDQEEGDIHLIDKNEYNNVKRQLGARKSYIEKLQKRYDFVNAMCNGLKREVSTLNRQIDDLRAGKDYVIKNLKEKHKTMISDRDEMIKYLNRELASKNRQVVQLEKTLFITFGRLRKASADLEVFKNKVVKDTATRGLRRVLKFSSYQHDASYMPVIMWMYSYMHGGNILEQKGKAYADLEYEMSRRIKGQAEGQNINIEINLDKIDPSQSSPEAPNVFQSYIGRYRFDQNEIPQELVDALTSSSGNEHPVLIAIRNGMTFADLNGSQAVALKRAMEYVRKDKKDLRDQKIAVRNSNINSIVEEISREIDPAFNFMDEDSLSEVRDRVIDNYILFKYKPSTDERADAETMQRYREQALENPDDIRLFARQHPTLVTDAPVEMGRIKNMGAVFDAQFKKINNITRFIDGKTEGPMYKFFLRDTLEAEQNYIRGKTRRQKEFFDAFDEIVGKGNQGKFSKNANSKIEIDLNNGIKKEITRWEAMGIYIYAKNMMSFRKLVNNDGNNIDIHAVASINPEFTAKMIEAELLARDAQDLMTVSERKRNAKTPLYSYSRQELEELETQIESGNYTSILNEQEIQLSNKMIELLAKEQGRFVQAAYDNDNILIDVQDNYFPLRAYQSLNIGDLRQSVKSQALPKSGNTEVRNPYAMYALSLNPLSTFLSSIDSTERYINMTQQCKNMNYAMSKKGNNLGQIISDRYGKEFTRAITDYMDSIANREEDLKNYERLVNRMLGNLAKSKLMLNVMTAAKQLVSVIPAVTDGEINIMDFVSSTLHMKEVNSLVAELAPEINESSASLEVERMRQMLAGSGAESNIDKITDFAMSHIEAVDKWVKKNVWYASYAKSIEKGSSSRDAALRASELVGRTQSVYLPEFTSSIQRNHNPFLRSVLLFTNDLFQSWNILYGGAVLDFKERKFGKAVEKLLGLLLQTSILAFAAGHFIPGEDDDEEDKIDVLGTEINAKQFARDFAIQGLEQVIPLIGPSVSDAFSGWSQSIFSQSLSDAASSVKYFWNLATGEAEDISAEEFFSKVFQIISVPAETLVGFPTVAVERIYDTVFPNGITEDSEFSPAYLLGQTWGDGIYEAVR